jgi:transposase
MLLAGDLVTAKPNPAQRGALSIVTDTERASRQRRQERKMAAIRARELGGVYFPNTPRCGELLRYIKEPCARLAGHADHHRSRASLEADNARRRSA